MLAQNFQTPAALGLTDARHRALVLTLNALERGELCHEPFGPDDIKPGENFTGHFNMAMWNKECSCNTVCCIAGTAELLGGLEVWDFESSINQNPGLFNLLYACDCKTPLSQITPAQAAITLRSYLTTGNSGWKHIT
jgi:hypothetical protein